jgi:hypothetical protein
MSLFDRGYSAFKRIVLLDEKIGQIRDDVSELKSASRSHENRLVRLETIVQLGLAMPTQPHPSQLSSK